ncbi:filamentous hemagglutinin N-terminal domain-containing protein [Baaleninema sp.]|uniref:two-partner secretion domain-containing protein n=1 Tax=Baaleninema sp. TaxID=3101197 RepID=UPI003D06C9BC
MTLPNSIYIELKNADNSRFLRNSIYLKYSCFLHIFNILILSTTLILFKAQKIGAQLIPDETLETPSIVENEGNTSRIRNGSQSNLQLFHSFKEFNISENQRVIFENAPNIENIFTRVTGENASTIAGTLQTQGTANFFLINPNGILFKDTARLDVGGSFLATTADRILFENGTAFSATSPETPLLTVTVPVGLQCGDGSGEIRVEGRGHNLAFSEDIDLSPLVSEPIETGLQVPEGATLALLGGNVTLHGGLLEAPNGRLELAAVASGSVNLISEASGWRTEYEAVSEFADIQLSQQSLATTRGRGGGNISLHSRNLDVRDGSMVLLQTWGAGDDGTLRVRVSDTLSLSGNARDETLFSRLRSATWDDGRAADIDIAARTFTTDDLAIAQSLSFGAGDGGGLRANAADTLDVRGRLFNGSLQNDIFGTIALASGNAGHLDIQTRTLRVRDGRAVGSFAFGSGQTGDVTVTAAEQIELTGDQPRTSGLNFIGSVTRGSGEAGKLTIETRRLIMQGGSGISTTTLGAGDAGSVRVNATESIELRGANPNLLSIISSASVSISPEFVGDIPPPSGDAGNVDITTSRLVLGRYSSLSVQSNGLGEAGSLTVNAEVLTSQPTAQIVADTRSNLGGNVRLNVGQLDFSGDNIDLSAMGSGDGGNLIIVGDRLTLDETTVRVASQEGNGGNIRLNLSDAIVLQNGSRISTRAGTPSQGTGNGGNMILETGTLTLLENSRLEADAFAGRGGNIRVFARGFFQSPDSRISASSRLGIDGTIDIETPQFSQENLFALNPEESRLTETVVDRCTAFNAGSEFVFVGRGGLPPTPFDPISQTPLWQDFRALEQLQEMPTPPENHHSEALETPLPLLREATAWTIREDGAIELVSISEDRAESPSSSRCWAWRERETR